jgi:Tol biopolymer transport system component
MAASALACSAGDAPPAPEHETIFVYHPAAWFEHAWSYYEVSRSADRALYGARFGFQLIDLLTGRRESASEATSLARVNMAYFLPDGRLMRFQAGDEGHAWFAEGDAEPQPIPPFSGTRLSPDGRWSAYFDATQRQLVVSPVTGGAEAARYPLPGFGAGISWAPDSARVYALMWEDEGTATVFGVAPGDDTPAVILDELDTTWRFGTVAASEDGQSLYLAAVGAGPAAATTRHRPGPIRELDIYRLDLDTGAMVLVVDSPGDDFAPQITGGHLYWTHNVISDSVVAFPSTGGEPWLVAEGAEIPTWSPDGSRIGLTYGGWRLADWALNLDAGFIEVDENARPVSEITPIVVGYHEDFSPAWSPDGRWIAYHSHRSAEPVSYYGEEGSTDSIYLRRPEAPVETEISLFDFGWEVGNADWSPDGRRLVFESWDRAAPGASWSWIAKIDPDTGETLSLDRLPLPEGVMNISWSAWSPAGDEIAVVESLENGRQAIWVLDLLGGEPERLVEFNSSTYGGVDWAPDGRSLVYGALVGARMQIFSVPRGGGEPAQLTHADTNLMHPQVSPDGRLIACSRMDQAKELRRMPLR